MGKFPAEYVLTTVVGVGAVAALVWYVDARLTETARLLGLGDENTRPPATPRPPESKP